MNFLFSNPVDFINTVQPPFSSVIIFCATTLGSIVIVLAVAFLIFHYVKNRGAFSGVKNMFAHIHDFIFVSVSTCGAYILAYVLKNIFQVARPFVTNTNLHPLISETGYGFPSGHATTYMALAVAMYFVNKKAGIAFFIFAILIGFGRIFTGVHTPLDVLAGYILGAIFACVIAYFDRKARPTASVAS
jgi:membrane-associated phospholipid phosphatase